MRAEIHANIGEGANGDHIAIAIAHMHAENILNRCAVPFFGLQAHAPAAAKQVEVVDVHRAKEDLQGLSKRVDQLNAELRKLSGSKPAAAAKAKPAAKPAAKPVAAKKAVKKVAKKAAKPAAEAAPIQDATE